MPNEGRQLVSDYSVLLSSLQALLSIAITAFVLVWFYKAIKRIEESLREIRERLGSSERGADQPGPNLAPPSASRARKVGRISNVWGIPAILFIIGAIGGYPLFGWALTRDLFGAAGLMALVAVAWEVIRKEIRV
jgi:hypothetical protein